MSNLFYCGYSKTIRIAPQNYWIASLREGNLIFDSWDGMTKELFDNKTISKCEVSLMAIKIKFGIMIQDIINNYENKYNVITMNNRFIRWAAKKGYVRIISATQQEFTTSGFTFFFGK